jgi:hypothetical protein
MGQSWITGNETAVIAVALIEITASSDRFPGHGVRPGKAQGAELSK